MRVLIVEDDIELGAHLDKELTRIGYVIDIAPDLEQARTRLVDNEYDVVVLDRSLPDGDGLSLISELRSRHLSVPVLVLSALGEVNHRVEGLRLGGDDYLVKPFDIAELSARLEALRRRAAANNTSIHLQVGELSIDLLSHEVSRAGQEIRLQPREYKLLEFLARNSGQVVTRTMLLEAVWGLNFDPQTNVVDVHISRLRNKLDAGFSQPLLHTVRGEGYRLAATP